MSGSMTCDESPSSGISCNERSPPPGWSLNRTRVAPSPQTASGSRVNSPFLVGASSRHRHADRPWLHQPVHHRVENTPLTSPPSASPRLDPRHFQVPTDAYQSHPQAPALFPLPRTFDNTSLGHHVLRLPVNALPQSNHRDQSTSNGSSHLTPPLESYQLSGPLPSQNVSLNTSSSRPRTSYPVFHSTSALAAHHGIPQSLPPAPRTTRYQQESSVASSSTSIPSSSNIDNFSLLCSSYLNMLSQKAQDQSSAVDATAPAVSVSDDVALQAVMEVLEGELSGTTNMTPELIADDAASPEYQSIQDFGEYLTSPLETPWEDFLNTPALGSGDPLLTSPAIADAGDFGSFGDHPLFADAPLDLGVAAGDSFKQSVPPFNFDGLYTLPSPPTPALDPQSLTPSPHISDIHQPLAPAASSGSRRKNAPTGTRKNITPEALIPVDAPIQTRKYVTPSATSRKEVPAAIIKKRARSQAFEDDDIELGPEDLDAIEAKRRQNTLAARRSRKRKLEYQQQLEGEADRMRAEMERWRARALTLEVLLQSHGHEVPQMQ
ncbi:hypothetical protein CERSUDRAFT_127396 [Gelatoporia subvermispora B]|uniref:BZIP domain-containing protein n=1 Tax=Ceriporiopsis subvermispora (strain B) TaxID=914234 RepID=M2Q3J8_CERS8|nr:hypothetical protein CERSUDRAFT_127396 [Gelatoporia subvermispora B]